MIFVFCLPLYTKVDPLDFFPTFYNMQSVSSNAVAQALGGYKDTGFTWISSTMLQALDQVFNATSNYQIFQGATSANNEIGFYGFRHNATKGGICIVMSRNYGVWCGLGAGLPSTWKFQKIISFSV